MNDVNRQLRRGAVLLCLLLFCEANYATAGAPPVVSNVRAAQRPGTQLVDIYYDLADPDSASLAITVLASTNGGASYTLQRLRLGQCGHARLQQTNHLERRRGLERALPRQRPLPRHRQ